MAAVREYPLREELRIAFERDTDVDRETSPETRQPRIDLGELAEACALRP